MKLPLLLVLSATTMLASCATSVSDKPWVGLYEEQYMRSEQKWPMTLPKTQQALFAHESKCGSAPNFEVDSVQPNIAYVWRVLDDSAAQSNTVLLELARLRGETLRVRAYSSVGVSEDEITRLQNTILTPEVCD